MATKDDYDAVPDPLYCYEGSSVLKNKAGLRKDADLQAFELVREVAQPRIAAISVSLV